MDVQDVCRFLKNAHDRGERAILVTVCAVEGSSMRNPGTIMGVAQDGSFAGSLSGGCIENAVVSEALDVLASGAPRVVRYGAGSPYLDIRLPCGGGLDLHFYPLDKGNDLAVKCLQSCDARRPFSIIVSKDAVAHRDGWHHQEFDQSTNSGAFGHWPIPRLNIIGHGAGVEALAALGAVMGCEINVLTPDERIVAVLKAKGHQPILLKRRTQTDLLSSDPWSGFIFLFHDHDWEIDLMQQALTLPHFYLGAMGGRRAHGLRTQALLERGAAPDQIDAIRAPIGVFHSSRDPQTLALSTLAEVIRTYQNTDFESDLA